MKCNWINRGNDVWFNLLHSEMHSGTQLLGAYNLSYQRYKKILETRRSFNRYCAVHLENKDLMLNLTLDTLSDDEGATIEWLSSFRSDVLNWVFERFWSEKKRLSLGSRCCETWLLLDQASIASGQEHTRQHKMVVGKDQEGVAL